MKWLILTIMVGLAILSLSPCAPAMAVDPDEDTVQVVAVPYLGEGIMSFSATIISDTEVFLIWVKGENIPNVMVRAKYSSMPTSRTDGYLVYEGEESSTWDTSMNFDEIPGTIYYRIWAQNDEGVWLDSQVNTQTTEAPVLQLIALLILVMFLVGLAFWRKEIFLYIIALVSVIFFSVQLSEVSIPMTIPVWILAVYMLMKCTTYYLRRRQ